MDLAYSHFKLIFITEEPWVPWGNADVFADDAWEIACIEAGADIDDLPPTNESRGLVSPERTSSLYI